MLSNHCQLIGFSSIERLLTAEVGMIMARKFNDACIEKLILLNQHITPIEYEKRRISPRTNLEIPELCIEEVGIPEHLLVYPWNDVPHGICLDIRYEDQLLCIKRTSCIFSRK